MPAYYDLAVVREMLVAAFGIGGINTLAFDLFPSLYDDFAGSLPKNDRVEQIVAEAARTGRVSEIADYVEKNNKHQYDVYAPRLLRPSTSPSPALQPQQQQRLEDLQHHLEQDTQLLRQYEDLARQESDPRRLLGIRAEIRRQQEAVAGYRQALAELQGQVSETTAAAAQPSLDDVSQKLDALSQQIAVVHEQVVRSEGAIRQDLVARQTALLNHITQEQRQAVATLVQKLDASQLETVELLLDAHDQQQIAQWQAEQMLLLLQQAAVDLRRLRADQPDAAQWQSLVQQLQAETSWQQKLKWTLPIIPGILEFESETAVDVIPALKQSWQSLRQQFRRLRE